jgi:predicted histidine transporter YuiF (NhaC family)
VGIGDGASIALSYGILGAFALALAETGLPHALKDGLEKMVRGGKSSRVRWGMIGGILLIAISSQNILPIHIAFIPLIIPPLLLLMIRMQIDRRMIACILTFGLITPYMLFPAGFGEIFLKQILLGSISKSGLNITNVNVIEAMWIPATGMVMGLLWAVFVSYRKPRYYDDAAIHQVENENAPYTRYSLMIAVVAIILMLAVQIKSGSMIFGGLVGFLVIMLSGVLPLKMADSVFGRGVNMMAGIGLVMMTASGFAEILRETGHVQSLVELSMTVMGGSRPIAAFMMLFLGLLVTLGIGSSFSTVPILATLYVPLCVEMGFSTLAIVALIGTAGALGDAGSPVSDSTLGPTAGLNIDGQHNHIWDSVIPTFIHYNIPLFVMGWVAAMIL